jgi:hypothetical protein
MKEKQTGFKRLQSRSALPSSPFRLGCSPFASAWSASTYHSPGPPTDALSLADVARTVAMRRVEACARFGSNRAIRGAKPVQEIAAAAMVTWSKTLRKFSGGGVSRWERLACPFDCVRDFSDALPRSFRPCGATVRVVAGLCARENKVLHATDRTASRKVEINGKSAQVQQWPGGVSFLRSHSKTP